MPPPYNYIISGLSKGTVIPFLGAGASLGARNPASEPWARPHLPLGRELARHLAKVSNFPGDDRDQQNLSQVAQYYEMTIGRAPLHQELNDIFGADIPALQLHTLLASLPSPLPIVTTNYDDLVERAFIAQGKPFDLVVHTTDPGLGDQLLHQRDGRGPLASRSVDDLNADLDLRTRSIIYKMHGFACRDDHARSQYVISDDDYVEFLARMTRGQGFPSAMIQAFRERPFLFLGYSLQDWNLRVLLNRIRRERRADVKSWAIQHAATDVEKRFWATHEVIVFEMPLGDFVAGLDGAPRP